MTGAWVRAAHATDAAAVAEVQVRTWRSAYRQLVPEPVLAEMTSPEARTLWQERWSAAVTAAPSPHHRLLVAVEATAPATAGPEPVTGPAPAAETEPADEAATHAAVIVGFSALGPTADPDLATEQTGELLTLLVDPSRQRRGHGSRLLAASVDHLREDGYTTAVTWVFEGDKVMRDFFAATGWAPDGTRRALDMEGEPVPMLRMHTALGQHGQAPAQSPP